jgi:hypothetical protein
VSLSRYALNGFPEEAYRSSRAVIDFQSALFAAGQFALHFEIATMF